MGFETEVAVAGSVVVVASYAGDAPATAGSTCSGSATPGRRRACRPRRKRPAATPSRPRAPTPDSGGTPSRRAAVPGAGATRPVGKWSSAGGGRRRATPPAPGGSRERVCAAARGHDLVATLLTGVKAMAVDRPAPPSRWGARSRGSSARRTAGTRAEIEVAPTARRTTSAKPWRSTVRRSWSRPIGRTTR